MKKLKLLISILAISGALINSATATPFSLEETFNDPTITTGDQFGSAVAISGNKLLIGAPGDDTSEVNVGQAHLFDATTGVLLQTFNDPTVVKQSDVGSGFAFGGDGFGSSVAISGNNVLIGAAFDDTSTTSGFGGNSGQAHLFDATTGSLVRTFDDPAGVAGDIFGLSLAVDSSRALISARGNDTGGQNVGQVYLFDNSTGDLLTTFDDPTPTALDSFGSSIALDGNKVFIGSNGDDTNGANVGQVHLFDASTGNLLQTFNDPTATTSDGFGTSISVADGKLLIGAPGHVENGIVIGEAYLFDIATGTLLATFNDPTPPASSGGLAEGFGNTVALSGNNVLIGTPFDDTIGGNVGQAHLFDINGLLLQTFNDPTLTRADQFGVSVAIEGSNILIGATGNDVQTIVNFSVVNNANIGEAHLFTLDNVSPVPLPAALPLYGTGLALLGFIGWRRKRKQVC